MKLVYLIGRADTIGGTQRHVLDLAVAMSGRGHDVTVLTGPSGPFTSELLKSGVHTIPIDSLDAKTTLSPRTDFRAETDLRKLLTQLQPDLLTTHSTKGGMVGRVAAKRLGLPVIYTLHGVPFGPGVPTLRRVIGNVLELAMRPLTTAMIAVSDYDRRLAIQHRVVTAGRICAVLNAVPDRKSPTTPSGVGRSVTNMVMVARLAKQKDHELLLRTLASTSGLGEWTLKLVGDGEITAQLQALTDELGLEDRIEFTGLVTDVDALLDASDVAVLISKYEGLPVAIVEALRAGRPNLVSNVGGVAEVVRMPSAGWLVKRSDAASLASALREALDPATDLAEMGARARETYDDLLGFEQFVSKTEAAYVEAVDGNVKLVSAGGTQ